MRRMFMPVKILYIHGITKIGGAETDLLAILKGLDRTRLHPSVACPPTGAFIERIKEMAIPIFPLSFPSWRKLKDSWRIPFAVLSLASLLKREKFDLVHVNDYWWAPIAWLACRTRGIPSLVHVRQQIHPSKVKQYWLTKPDRVLAISQEIRQAIIDGGGPLNRVQVVYSGIDFSSITPTTGGEIRTRYGLQSGQPLIGAVANLFPRKGYEYLVKALAEIRMVIPDIHCLILGEGDHAYHQNLLHLITMLDLNSAVTFAGFQPDVLAHMVDFDVVVLPSIMEGFGMVLLEAMAMGKPIVASKVGGIPEAVEDGVTGVLIPPAHSGKLAEVLVFLLKNGSLRRSMGEAGRKRVATMFSLEKTIQELERVYDQVLSQPLPELSGKPSGPV
jgi:glycosyltransferase involved in cell wall biosynthesis